MDRRRWMCAALALGAGAAVAQEWPSRPIQVIVPFPPGSVDAKARRIIDQVGKILGQPMVAVNKPGAGMRIGTEQMVRSAPDGYTIGVAVQASCWISPEIDPGATYSAKDMTMLGIATEAPMVLVVNPSSAIRSMDDLLRTARAQPGKLNYAAPSGGSAFRVVFELMKSVAGIDVTFVPYRGLALALQDVVAGQVELGFADFGSIQLITSGRLRPLAVSGARRSPSLPDVPTLREAGVPLDFEPWLGFAAPKGLPREVQTKLAAAFSEALRMPEVRSVLEADGTTKVPADTSGPGMARRVERELAEFRKNVKPGTIKFN